METYSSSRFKRSSTIVDTLIKQKDGMLLCLDDFRVVFPERYINQELAVMGSTVRTINIFAIIDSKNNYCVALAPIFIDLTPSNIIDIEIDNVIHKCLTFDKGSTFTNNTSLLKTGDFLYNLFDEFFIKGKIPWFIDYNDISDLLIESSKYTGSGIGDNPIAYEILASVISRKAGDKNIKFRHTLKNNSGDTKPEYVGLNNIYYSYDNTAGKLVGGYYGAGVTAAVVVKETQTTVVADLLRA